MKATRRFVTSAILVSLLVVGVLGTVLLSHKTFKPRLGLDLEGGLSIVLTAPQGTRSDILDETVNILRNRIDGAGVAEPQISREGANNILIEVPGVKDPDTLIKLVGQTAKLNFRPVINIVPGGPSATLTATVPEQNFPTSTVVLKDSTGNLYQLGPAAVQGEGIQNAAATVDPNTGAWSVQLTFKSNASNQWQAFTGKLACNPQNSPTRQVAIDLDSQVQSAPQMGSTVQCNVGIGTTSITGNFTETQAKNLALVLNAGALPVTLKPSEVQTVSATLGKSSLRAGLIAGGLGLVLVMLYVAVYYRTLGFQTWIGLFAFSSLTYAVVVLLGRGIGFSLTLAGIAGLIVSVGITTDSYIVFFERVKEEVHAGKTLRSSIDRGFKSARGTLFTADSVTFFAALILYVLAVGSVRGFALTLGVATALDVALFLAFTYPLAALLARRPFFADTRGIGMLPTLQGTGQRGLARKIYRSEFKIDFVGRRKLWLTISGVAVFVSLLVLIPGIRGLRYGIDFRGGSVFTSGPPITKSVTVPGIKAALDKAGVKGVAQVQIATDRSTHEQQVKVQTDSSAVQNNDDRTKIVTTLNDVTGAQTSSDTVGKTWGGQITQKAVRGLVVFLIVVILYMSWRLETKMAIAGIVALLHDLAITAGVYAVTGLEVTPATVIAVLTILGYSLYDTVVVFDKIKENAVLPSNARKTYSDLSNDAMNQVLMRSINTSLMTLLPVGSLLFVGSFLLGADTLRDLALALFVGIAAGTYSSIFVATPLLSMLKEREPRYAALKAGRRAAGEPVLAGKAGTRTPASGDAGAAPSLTPPATKKRPAAKPVVAAADATIKAHLADDDPDVDPDDEIIEGVAIGAAGAGTIKPAPQQPARQPGSPVARQQPKRPNRKKKKGGR